MQRDISLKFYVTVWGIPESNITEPRATQLTASMPYSCKGTYIKLKRMGAVLLCQGPAAPQQLRRVRCSKASANIISKKMLIIGELDYDSQALSKHGMHVKLNTK